MTGRGVGDRLRRMKEQGTCAFMPFITCGYPSKAGMRGVLGMLKDAGADCLELGVPFSDPMADGVTIQQSSQAALEAGTTPEDCLRIAETAVRMGHEVALMSYANPIMRRGLRTMSRLIASAGVTGLIVPDLPLEEAAEWGSVMEAEGIDLAMFAAPTTSEARLREAGRLCRAFLYYVARTGVTGERSRLAAGLTGRLRRVREIVSAPVCVGFGVSTPAQARLLSRLADGVIVGSALVRRLKDWRGSARQRRQIGAWVRAMARATKQAVVFN